MNDKLNFLNFFFDSGKFAEEAIADKLTELYPAMICVYDARSKRLNYVNKRFKEYLGDSLQNIQTSQDPLTSLVIQEDIFPLNAELEKFRFLQERGYHSFNCRLKHSRDAFHYFKVSGTVLKKGNDGYPTSILFIADDITEQMKTQEEVEARNELFDETEETLHFGTWSWDAKRDSITWTRGMYKLLGYDPIEFPQGITNDFYMSHVLPEWYEEVNNAVERAMATREPFDIEYHVRNRNGEHRIFSTKGKVHTGTDGEVKKIFGITHDVTAVRNFEKEQERSLRELNRSNKELEEFAYVASHDLQEPLRKIAMFSERLRAKCNDVLDKDAQLFLNRILASADNMKVLIDNLLEFSRANRSSKAYEKLALADIVLTVKTSLELKIEETGTTINVDALPKLDVVKTEMEQVFSNLISNAIKFRRPDVAPVIDITSRKATRQEKAKHGLNADDSYHVIEVRDNGIGFEPEYAEKIFQVFQRLHGKAEYPGSGIGLAICKKIIDNHSGMIYGTGRPGEGSTFTIILPEKQS